MRPFSERPFSRPRRYQIIILQVGVNCNWAQFCEGANDSAPTVSHLPRIGQGLPARVRQFAKATDPDWLFGPSTDKAAAGSQVQQSRFSVFAMFFLPPASHHERNTQ